MAGAAGGGSTTLIFCTILCLLALSHNVTLAQVINNNVPKPNIVLPPPPPALQIGFYGKSCPQAEQIVNQVVHKNFLRDPTLAPALVRLFFHDCFVTGCDASLLLDATPTQEEVEKDSTINGPTTRGYEVIDEIKARMEAECPGAVSCADILAFANRDSLNFTGIPFYPVAAGRRDARVSLATNVEGNIPQPTTPVQEIIQRFQMKGMSLEELVVLTGAHSIGTAHCTSVANRFLDPQKTRDIDRGFLLKMISMAQCRSDTQTLPFDPYTQHKMDSRYYDDMVMGKALLESDHNLEKVPEVNNMMKAHVQDQNQWLQKFTNAIMKLGQIQVLTGNQGEIRKQCRVFNI